MRAMPIAVVALCLLGTVLAPAASARVTKAIWGPVEMPDGSSAFPVYQDLGVDVFQIQLQWERTAKTRPADPTNPNDPAYTWPAIVDDAVNGGAQSGMSVALLVKGSPPWANGGQSPAFAPSNKDFADFLTAASRRYGSVRRWMVWGEPNRASNFRPAGTRAGPRRYATLLRAAYRALKRRSRRNVVIGGLTSSFGDIMPRTFLRFMRLPNGKPPPLDLYGHNGFADRFPRLRNSLLPGRALRGFRDISDSDTFAREIHNTYKRGYRRFRRRGPKIWIAEYTVSSDQPNRAFPYAVSRREQARWLKAAFGIARRPYIAGLGWFNLLDEPVTAPNHLTTGLITYEGKRKRAYGTYKRVP